MTALPTTAAAGGRQHHRLLASSMFIGVLALMTVFLLHGRLPKLTLPPHHIGWLIALTAVAIGTSYVWAAVALRAAAGRPLPWGRTVLAQLAAALANRLVPAGIGGVGVNLRYLHKTGISAPAAAVAVTLVAVGNGLATMILAVAVVPAAATSIHVGHVTQIAAIAAGAVAIIAAAVFASRRRIPVRMQTHLTEVRQALAGLRADPKRLALIIAGTLGVKVAHIAALLTALAAFGSQLPVLVVVAVYLAGSAAASAVPTPSGLGAVEAALVSGLVAVGGPLAVVVGGVLVFRLASFWMPIIPGMAAAWALRRAQAM